jgi:protein-S-isoprenylcysteine O-methyltransferase Ste14
MQTGFWWILFSLLIYGVIHSLLAALKTKELVQAWLGINYYRRFYRLFFSSAAAVLFVPVLMLVALLPDQLIYRIPAPWIWLTVIIQVLAVVLMVHSVMMTGAGRFLGLAQAIDPDQAEKPLPLVKRGMYRLVRHPIYTCTFLLIWLMPLMSWNILALNIGVTAYMLIGARIEEQKLLLEFGDAYDQFRKDTAFIIPWIK